MAGRGPCPKPLSVVRAEGDPRKANPGIKSGKGREAPPADTDAAKVPEPPDSLAKGARAEWRRIAPQLSALGLTELDLGALEIYCSTLDAWREAAKADSASRLSRDLATVLRQYATELGLTPGARARVHRGVEPQRASDIERDREEARATKGQRC